MIAMIQRLKTKNEIFNVKKVYYINEKNTLNYTQEFFFDENIQFNLEEKR